MSRTDINISSSPLLVTKTAYVDAVYGDDSTGTVGRFDLPSKTIKKPVNELFQVFGGGNVVVRPGTYDELVGVDATGGAFNRIVNVTYDEGAIHTYTGADPNALFHRVTGTTSNIHIYGRGVFLRAGSNPINAACFHNISSPLHISVFGAKSIKSTLSWACINVEVIENVDLIESTADGAIFGSSFVRDIGIVRSTASVAIGASNGIQRHENIKLVESTVTSIFNGTNTFQGGVIARNCNYRNTGGSSMSPYGVIRLEQCSVENLWDNPSGHGLHLTRAEEIYSHIHLKDVTLKLANASANAITNGLGYVNCHAQNVVSTNVVLANTPEIVRFIPTNPEENDVYRIDSDSTADFIDYTVLLGDTVLDVLTGLKAAWMLEVGSGSTFDLYIGENSANSYLLDITSGTALFATQINGGVLGATTIFVPSVVDAGGALTPTLSYYRQQVSRGVVMQVEDILVDEEVTIDLVI